MGDQPEIQNLSTETFLLTYHGMEKDRVTVDKLFTDGADLTRVADLFRRFLLASGYSVKSVEVNTGAATFSSEDAF